MISSKSIKWLDAGHILQNDPNAKVPCPECEVGILVIKDEPIGTSGKRIDRYLVCNNCGKWNVITMELPQK